MQNQKTSWFTLVELIVVITILAILWTISFISLQWYSEQSRDSVRISDLSSIKTGLELYNLDAGKYPSPNDETVITFSWAVAWTQWTFWEQAKYNIAKLDKVPTDPLTDKKYVYSTNSTRYEFQLAWAMEWDEITLNPSKPSLKLGKEQLQTSAASTKTARLKITWNYNGKLLKVSTGSTDYVLAIPSLIAYSGTTIEVITANNYLAYNGYKNLPFQYDGTYNVQWETSLNLVNTTNYVVFSWSLSTLSDSTSTWINARKVMLDKLQLAYSGTSITWIWEIAQILNTNTSDPVATEYVATNLVSNNLWGSIVASSTSSSSSSSTSGSTSSTWWPVWLIDQSTCESANWIWVSSSTDVNIWSVKWSWFCISPRYWDWNTDSNTWNWWISWSGWWNSTAVYYNWWNALTWALNVSDSGNSSTEFWQTKSLVWADASSNPTSYTCKSLWTATSDYDTSDTLVWRMKWLSTTGNDYTQAQNIDWITGITPINWHAMPAIFIADCIDWVKDLWTTMTYKHINDSTENITYSQYSTDETGNTEWSNLSFTTYLNRQKYLTAWTQKSGSHLPSAFSFINSNTAWGVYASWSTTNWDLYTTANAKWEYQVACEAGKFWSVTYNWTNQYTWSSDDIDNEWIWTSAIGSTTGTAMGRRVRFIGSNGCWDQDIHNTSYRYGTVSSRFIIRP